MPNTDGEILVLEEHITRDDFLRLAKDQGWQRQRVQQGDGERVSFQEIWTTPDGTGVINFIDDPTLMSRQVWLRGTNLKELLVAVRRRLPAFEQGELLERAAEAQGHDEAVKAILDVAAGFLNADPDAIALFEDYLSADSPLLRKATLQAIGYGRWPAAVTLLETAAKQDPDESVRDFALQILQNPEPAR